MHRTRVAAALASLSLVAVVAGCTVDRGGRKDLPNDNQVLDESDAQIFLFPDRYPNVAHKCDGETGIWTTTGRDVWIVYSDPKCGAPLGEGRAPIVLDNIPGASPGAEG